MGAKAVSHRALVGLETSRTPPAGSLVPLPEPTIGASLENSVCLKHPERWLDAHPRNGKASTELCSGVVLALVPIQDNLGLSPCGFHRRRVSPPTAFGPPGGGRVPAGAQRAAILPETMRMLRVKGTAAPEVKFLDRCKTRCSEGVLQAHVCRSRTKVWGAKMIRHRCSPQQ